MSPLRNVHGRLRRQPPPCPSGRSTLRCATRRPRTVACTARGPADARRRRSPRRPISGAYRSQFEVHRADHGRRADVRARRHLGRRRYRSPRSTRSPPRRPPVFRPSSSASRPSVGRRPEPDRDGQRRAGPEAARRFTTSTANDISATLSAVADQTMGCTFEVPPEAPDGTQSRDQHRGHRRWQARSRTTHVLGWDYVDATHASVRLRGAACVALRESDRPLGDDRLQVSCGGLTGRT